MNYEYQCDQKENVYVKTDSHPKVYKYIDNIEKVLIKENIIETLEKKEKDNIYNMNLTKNKIKIIKKLILWSSILIPLLAIPYIIELSSFVLFVPLVVGILATEVGLTKIYKKNNILYKKQLFNSIAINKIINKNKKELKVLNRKNEKIKMPTNEEKIVHDNDEIKNNLLDVKALAIYLADKEKYIELYKQELLDESLNESIEIIDRIKEYIKRDTDETIKYKIRN